MKTYESLGRKTRLNFGSFKLTLALLSAAIYLLFSSISANDSETCPQPNIFTPTPDPVLDQRFKEYFNSSGYVGPAVERFAGSLRIPTVSYDSMGGNNIGAFDPELHKAFLTFHNYLQQNYPLIHSKLNRHIIANYSLIFEWKVESNLKPIMLMAHMDVVPIDAATINEWKFPPFSGEVSDGKVYGRGATDTKLSLISILNAVESMLDVEFTPSRSIFLCFGHDEEISGFNGALKIVEYLQDVMKIPENGFEFILDEGLSLLDYDGFNFALIGTTEGGYMDLNMTVAMKSGGHSSIPPPHTGIGILAELITTIESNPFPLELEKSNPTFTQLQCEAKYLDTLTARQKWMLSRFDYFKNPLLKSLAEDVIRRASLTTTQAVDVIQGGVKVNALPQLSSAMVNFRINPADSVDSASDRIRDLLLPVAKKHTMNLEIEVSHNNPPGEKTQFDVENAKGTIFLYFEGLEPAPVTSSDGDSFIKLGGVIKHVFGESSAIVPSRMQGNTDTRWSWNRQGGKKLSENIFRFSPYVVNVNDKNGVHTVNEFAKIQSLIDCTKFYHELIRAFN